MLPQMSAGNNFQVGIASGKFHGVISAHTPTGSRTDMANLLRQFRGRGFTEETPALAGHVESAVDTFLHVAAGFFEYLAHLAGFDARQLFFIFAQQLADPIEQLAALRRRHQAPTGKGLFCGLHRCIDILRRRRGK